MSICHLILQRRSPSYSLATELDHLLGAHLVHQDHTLHGAALLAQHQEALFALAARRVHTSADPDRLCEVGVRRQRRNAVHEAPIGVQLLRLDHRCVAVLAGRVVDGVRIAGRLVGLRLVGASRY